MKVVVDASVVLRWFVDQDGHEQARAWLEEFVAEPDMFVAPDLLQFEVHGALTRLTPRRDHSWARRSFDRFQRLGIRTVPTDLKLFDRALELSAELRVAGHDAVYLAHAEALAMPWLTADRRILHRLGDDSRVRPL